MATKIKLPISRMWMTDAHGVDHDISNAFRGMTPSCVIVDELSDFTLGTTTYKDGITFSRGVDVDGDLWTAFGVDPAAEPADPGEWADSIDPLPDL